VVLIKDENGNCAENKFFRKVRYLGVRLQGSARILRKSS